MSETIALAQIKCVKVNVKTISVLFHSGHLNVKFPIILLSSSETELVQSFSSLCVHLSQNMTWDDQVNYIVIKLCGATGSMRCHCYCFPTSLNILICSSINNALYVKEPL